MPSAVKLSKEARRIVKQAIANIKNHPDQFDMDHWTGKNSTPRKYRTCGTSACLAGHIALAAGGRATKNGDVTTYASLRRNCKLLDFSDLSRPEGDGTDGRKVVPIEHTAERILGDVPSYDLFHDSEWPQPFRSQFEALTYDEYGEAVDSTPAILKKRANVAIARLRHFLKTGQ